MREGPNISLKAVNLRDGKPVSISIKNDETQNSSVITINTPSMELASDIVQDLVADFLSIREFKSSAAFPQDMSRLNSEILQKIEESNQLKTHFAANISESIQNLKIFQRRKDCSIYNIHFHWSGHPHLSRK